MIEVYIARALSVAHHYPTAFLRNNFRNYIKQYLHNKNIIGEKNSKKSDKNCVEIINIIFKFNSID